MDEFLKKHLKNLIIVAYILVGWYVLVNWVPEVFILLLPFILAYFVAATTQPLKRFIQKNFRFSERWAGICAWAIALVVFVVIVGFIVFQIVASIIRLTANSAQIIEGARLQITYLQNWFLSFQAGLPAEYSSYVTAAVDSFGQQTIGFITSLTTSLGKWVWDFATSLPSTFIFLLVFFLSSYFLCKDYREIKHSLALQVPPAQRVNANKIKDYSQSAIAKYLRGMAIMILIVYCVLTTGMLVLGVDYAFLIAILIACMDVLPMLGAALALVPWGLIQIFVYGNLPLGIGLIVLTFINAVIRQLSEPKVMSKSLGIYPLVTLVAMYIGLRFMGFAGIILFPILAFVIVSLQRAGIIRVWKTK
jgi:sporulation integral membrane protein YtvI